MMPLQQFLYERKLDLLAKEKRAVGTAQLAMTMQLQVIDSMLQFLASQQTEEGMTRLRLTLDKHATPIDDIKARQETAELTEALVGLAQDLDKEFNEQKKKDAIKYPLNNIPNNVKPKSVSSKIYELRKTERIPWAIIPKTRTITDRETGKKREALYMVRVTDDVAARLKRKALARNGKED